MTAPLPPQGFLLAELGMLEEPMAAIAIDVSPQTLIEYRKRQIGPEFAVVGRTILYHPTKIKSWLEAGGTRAFETEAPAPDEPHRDAPIKNALTHATPPPEKRKVGRPRIHKTSER
jgi:hypothetical protein